VNDRFLPIGTLSIVRGATSDSGPPRRHSACSSAPASAGTSPAASRAAPRAVATARPGSPNRSRPPRRESGAGSTGSHSAGPRAWYALGRSRGASYDVAERIGELLDQTGFAIHRCDRYQPVAASAEAKLTKPTG